MDVKDDFVAILKPVFDSCDISGDGVVSIDDILQLGKQHAFENLEVKSKIICSVIYFDFCFLLV